MVEKVVDPVEQIARKMASALGEDPDKMVPETGRLGAKLIPAWEHEREHALRFLAAIELKLPPARK